MHLVATDSLLGTERNHEALLRIRARDQYGHLAALPTVDSSDPPYKTTGLSSVPNNALALTGTISNQESLNSRLDAPVSKQTSLIYNSTSEQSKIQLKQTTENMHKQMVALAAKRSFGQMLNPEWHPPWKLYRVISGNNGWVHSLTVEPGNSWFASGCRDGLIKIWDLASGRLRLTLTGHIAGVRGLAVSPRHPYLFSCGDDKMVKCWDLEKNQVVRHYHGHLSGAHSLALHPNLDVLITAGRDAVGRVWDMRSREQVHCLTGHTNTIATIQCQASEPQIITGSHDTTIRLWDLKAARTRVTLTNHKKSVRSLVIHPRENTFASGATDNLKQWKFPDGEFIQNLSGHESIVNCLALNHDNVLVSAADNGSMFFWDWPTGYNFQRYSSPAQPGSIDSEAGILSMTFDQTGSRLITGESDKSIKMFKEDPNANEETHPINWKPDILKRRRY